MREMGGAYVNPREHAVFCVDESQTVQLNCTQSLLAMRLSNPNANAGHTTRYDDLARGAERETGGATFRSRGNAQAPCKTLDTTLMFRWTVDGDEP